MLHQLQSAFRRHLKRPFLRSTWGGQSAIDGGSALEEGCWWHQDAVAMGAGVTLDLWAEDQRHATHAASAIMRVLQRVDESMNASRPLSEVARINREAAHAAVQVSEPLFRLLQRALRLSVLTRGAFDITYTPASPSYDFRTGVSTQAMTLQEVLPGIGSSHIVLDELDHSVRFSHRATRIDISGLARAHAVDQAAVWLQRLGVQHAYLSAGGDSRVVGDRRGRPWSLGIRDPRAENELVAVLPLSDISVSTSYDHERSVMREGSRVRELIDPRTGQPARDAASVTVLAADGVTAEAVSKMLFSLGPTRGLEALKRLRGVEALIVSADGEVHATPGLATCHAAELGRPVDRSQPWAQ